MITALEIEIYDIKIPLKYEPSKIKGMICINDQSHEFKLNSISFILPVSLSLPIIQILIIYSDKEISRHEINQLNFQGKNRITEVLKFSEAERKNLTQRTNFKSIMLTISIHGITEKPTQALLNSLQFQVNSLKNSEKSVNSLTKMLDDSYKSRNDLQLSIDETTEQLESQIFEKNQIINSIFKESSDISKSLSLRQNESNQLKSKINALVLKLMEFEGIQQLYNSLNNEFVVVNDELLKQKDVAGYLEKTNTEIKQEYLKSLNEFEQQCQDYENIIKNHQKNKIELDKELEEANILNKSYKFEVENLQNTINHQQSTITRLESRCILYEKLEESEKNLKNLLNSEEIYKQKLKDEINHSAKIFKDQLSNYYLKIQEYSCENQENLEKLNQTNSELERKNELYSGLLQENQKLQAELILVEQHLCVKEDKNKIIDQLTLRLAEIQSENMIFKEKINICVSDFYNIDQKHRNCEYNINKLENIIKERNEEIISLKEIIVELQNLNSSNSSTQDDHIDIAINEYIKSRSLPTKLPFIKEKSGIYLYGKKRVKVKGINGKIFINVSGIDLTIEEFFQEFTLKELEKIDEKKKEKFTILRPVPSLRKHEINKESFNYSLVLKENVDILKTYNKGELKNGSLVAKKKQSSSTPRGYIDKY